MRYLSKIKPVPTHQTKVMIDTLLNLEGTKNALAFSFRGGPKDCIKFTKLHDSPKFTSEGYGKFKDCKHVRIYISSSEMFCTDVCVEFFDGAGEPLQFGNEGAVFHFSPEESKGNKADFFIFYNEGSGRVFSMGASSEEAEDMVFALVVGEEDSDVFDCMVRISILGQRVGICRVLSDLVQGRVIKLQRGANDD